MFGIPRGGVVVAHEIAERLDCPLDVLVVRKLGYPGHEEAHRGAFLHPIVRRFSGPSLVAEHHVLEDLFGMYCYSGTVDARQSISGRAITTYHAEEHLRPLHQFFSSQLSR